MKAISRTRIHTLVMMALLIAMEVVCNRFLSIRTPIVTIGFGFVPIMLAAMALGPARGAIVGGTADFLGAMLFPIGPYFPGFTLSAALSGVIYGLLLHDRRPRLRHAALAALLVNLVCSLCLDTLWLYLIMNTGVLALLPARLIKCAVMVPIQILLIQIAGRQLTSLLPNRCHTPE